MAPSQMSRAGFETQLIEITEEIVGFLDKATEMSRAALRRKLRKIINDYGMSERDQGQKVGQDGP
jgi:hypothetical protein